MDADRSVSDHRQVSTQFDIEQPVVDAGGWRVLAPFRFREYRLLIAAVSLSIFAEGMWAVVMALQVIELDNDPASLSLVATCLGVGLVAFVLVGGIAADRINQRTIIIAVEAVNVVAVSAVAVLGLLARCRSGIWRWPQRRWASPRRSSSPPTARSCRGSCPPSSCWPPTASKVSCARCSSAPSAPPSPASWSVRRSPSLGAVVVAVLFAVGLVLLVATRPAMKTPVAAAGSRAAAACCATCATASSSCCARRGCCGHCCSRACSCSWCWDRSRCCCRSSPRTASTTARRRTASSWRSSGWAAHWARWRCRRDGCPVAT